jgi:hypothetical protein
MKKAILLAVLWSLLLPGVIYGQNQGAPLPFEPLQFFSATGQIASNAKLCSFAAGTTTPQSLYTDAALTTPAANPLTLTATGTTSTNLYTASLNYKFILYANLTGAPLTCPYTGAVIWSRDQQYDHSQLMLSLNNTWTGVNTFTGGLIVTGGATTTAFFTSINNRQFCTVGTDFPSKFTNAAANVASTGGIVDCSNLNGPQVLGSDVFSSVTTAMTLIWPVGTVSASASFTMPANITTQFLEAGIVSIASAHTATITSMVGSTMSQHFAGAGQVFINGPNPTVYPQWFAGANGGAQVIAAISALPASGGTVDATNLLGAQTISSAIVIPAHVVLLLGSATTWTCSAAFACFTFSGGSSSTTEYGGAVIQAPGGVLLYTGGGTAFQLAPGAAGNFITGVTIDVDTIDCNAASSYGIQFGGAGWVQRTKIRFKHIWHCTTAGIDFQLGRKNDSDISGSDIDGSNLAENASLGTNAVLFEDSSAQSSYNLYEGNRIIIDVIRNTTGPPLSVASQALHNYIVTDPSSDYVDTQIKANIAGGHNTIIFKGFNPWSDYTATSTPTICGAGTCGVPWYPTFFMNSTLTGTDNTYSVPPQFLSGMAYHGRNVTTSGPVPVQDRIDTALQDNLIVNGGFENGIGAAGWTGTNMGMGAAILQMASAEGAQSYVMVSTAGQKSYLYQGLNSLVLGKTVIGCAWFQWNSGGAASAHPGISISDSNGETYSDLPAAIGSNGNAGVTVGDGNWYYVCASRNIGAMATTPQIRLYADRVAGANAATVYVDGAGVYLGDMPSLYNPTTSAAVNPLICAPKSVSLVNGANSNIDATGACGFIFTGPSGAYNLTGFVNGVVGQTINLLFSITQVGTIKNNVTSTQKILTVTGADIVFGSGISSAMLTFDGTFWWVLAARSVSGPQ